MTLLIIAALSTTAHADSNCDDDQDSYQTHLLDIRFSLERYTEQPETEPPEPEKKLFAIGAGLARAYAACSGPFYASLGGEFNIGIPVSKSSRTSVGLDGIGQLTIGHAPPISLEIGIGSYFSGGKLKFRGYVGAYLSVYYGAVGARWGISSDGAYRAATSVLHLPFNASGFHSF